MDDVFVCANLPSKLPIKTLLIRGRAVLVGEIAWPGITIFYWCLLTLYPAGVEKIVIICFELAQYCTYMYTINWHHGKKKLYTVVLVLQKIIS
jgi:hypothetical protein